MKRVRPEDCDRLFPGVVKFSVRFGHQNTSTLIRWLSIKWLKLPNLLRRVAGNDRIRLDVPRDNTSRGNDRPLPNCHALENCNAETDPDTILDNDRRRSNVGPVKPIEAV